MHHAAGQCLSNRDGIRYSQGSMWIFNGDLICPLTMLALPTWPVLVVYAVSKHSPRVGCVAGVGIALLVIAVLTYNFRHTPSDPQDGITIMFIGVYAYTYGGLSGSIVAILHGCMTRFRPSRRQSARE